MRVKAFWNVQVMLYSIGYQKFYEKKFFPKTQCHGHWPLAVNPMALYVAKKFLLLYFLIVHDVEHHFDILECFYMHKSDF